MISKEYLDESKKAVNDYIKATVPICTIKYDNAGKRKTLPVGSSFYVKYQNEFFLITAYHVFYDAKPFLVPSINKKTLKKSLEELHYEKCFIKDIDLIILKLPQQIQDSNFIPYLLFESELDDNYDIPKIYIAFGTPASKVHFYNGMMNGHFELFYSEEENEEEYKRLNRNKVEHLLLQFDKANVISNGKRINAPHPNGMSGGCVVSLHPKIINPIRLEGILIEWDIKRKKTMIALRKVCVKSLLEQIIKN